MSDSQAQFHKIWILRSRKIPRIRNNEQNISMEINKDVEDKLVESFTEEITKNDHKKLENKVNFKVTANSMESDMNLKQYEETSSKKQIFLEETTDLTEEKMENSFEETTNSLTDTFSELETSTEEEKLHESVLNGTKFTILIALKKTSEENNQQILNNFYTQIHHHENKTCHNNSNEEISVTSPTLFISTTQKQTTENPFAIQANIINGTCMSEGLAAHESNCSRFYICLRKNESGFEGYIYECNFGKFFNQKLLKCDFEENVENCEKSSVKEYEFDSDEEKTTIIIQIEEDHTDENELEDIETTTEEMISSNNEETKTFKPNSNKILTILLKPNSSENRIIAIIVFTLILLTTIL